MEKARHTVIILCRCLAVTRSGFYAWQRRPESARSRDDRRLKVLVQASCDASKQRYGSPRIHEDLIEQDEQVSRKRVVRLMQEEGLVARARKRYKVTTMSDHDQPVAANLLDRQFEADAPNQRWVGDTTEFVIGSSGKLYLAAVLDLFSRFIVGWAVSAVNDRHVTIKALEMALKRRCPDIGLLHHSDQGCTYASEDYQDLLEARGIVCSMSRRGNCWDNAVMEPRWTGENRPLIDTSKPATTGVATETGKFYFVASSGRKSVWTFVRQLRGPHFRTWAWCKRRSRSAVTAAVSLRSLPQSSTGRLDVRSVDARS